MSRSGWIAIVAVALLAFGLGKSLGPAPIRFPAPEDARSAEQMQTEVEAALREPRAFARSGALVRLGEGLTVENVEGAARAFRDRAGENDPVDLQLFLTAWTHLDPAAALREVQSWPIQARRELGLRIVMREWAAGGRTLEAGHFFETLTDPAQRTLLAGPLVRGWALSGDADGARALARRLFEAQEARADVVEALVRGVLHTGGASGALALARSLDPHAQDAFARSIVLSVLQIGGREDPAAAAHYYDELTAPGDVPPWLAGQLVRLAGLLRNESPQDALDWLLPKPDGAERRQALKETLGTWARRDFDAAWAWLLARLEASGVDVAPGATSVLPPATEAPLLAGAVRRMARIRPAEAAPWAMRLPPGPDRVQMLRRVAYFWSMGDAAAADAWIARLDLPLAELDAIREAATWGRSGNAPADPDEGDEEAEPASGATIDLGSGTSETDG